VIAREVDSGGGWNLSEAKAKEETDADLVNPFASVGFRSHFPHVNRQFHFGIGAGLPCAIRHYSRNAKSNIAGVASSFALVWSLEKAQPQSMFDSIDEKRGAAMPGTSAVVYEQFTIQRDFSFILTYSHSAFHFMNLRGIGRIWLWTIICTAFATNAFAAVIQPKTLRVEHGRPVVMVSRSSVLVLEFAREPIADALVAEGKGIRHCRARYRYQLYDGATGTVTNGDGKVAEIRQEVPGTGGTQTQDIGSQTSISAGEFHLSWSEGGAGARSWLYYRTDSPIRFIQQPQQIMFESVDREQMRRYLASRNVEEFVASTVSVQVIGPAVFSGELPTEAPVAGRVESGRVRDGAFELKLSDLATNTHYMIESTYDLRSGSWAPVHTFIAREPNLEWSESLGKDVNILFYRIRQAAQ